MGSKENGEERENGTDSKQSKENEDSDYEPARDSLSSQEDSTKTPNKKSPRVLKNTDRSFFRPTKSSSNRTNNPKSQSKPSPNNNRKKTQNHNSTPKIHDNKKSVLSRTSSEMSEEILTEIQIDGSDDESQQSQSNESQTQTQAPLFQKTEEMEQRVEKLEQELREVAALEISIYSVVAEHMSSAHKVHTPVRRLSRLYIHACQKWNVDKKATVAKNTVSGLVLVAKSCGNDVSRLMYWLSNVVVLREIIAQTIGNVMQSSPKFANSDLNMNGKFSPMKGKNLGIWGPVEDWRETCTFVSALEKIESWIFSRVVESVWWQALTPHMQSPGGNSISNKNAMKQGNFSIDLWNTAFQDAFTKLCPLRSNGHECGCLPVLAKMVMEQCVARLDVAMFNAILRESASEIPTDPVSDPIVDTKVLPIPAGHLSFGSGAQLKNSIGNWSRWLSDNFGLDSDDLKEEEEMDCKNDGTNCEKQEMESCKKSKTFRLLNELSDLLMLPKDLLLEKSIRKEVCPSIALSLVIRILCNFTPDEFCPDPVPGLVLEDLNSESMAERLSDKTLSTIFPYSASPLTYTPPSPADLALNPKSASDKLERRNSTVQRRGYTSDEDLEDLESPLGSFVDRTPPVTPNGNGNNGNNGNGKIERNLRYKLLREVWCE